MRTDTRCARRAAALLVAALLGGAAAARPAAAQPAPVVEVSPTGTAPGSRGPVVRTVGEALARVAPGGRVVLHPGTYREPRLVVRTPGITVEGRGRPTLDGENAREILEIVARDVTVRGLRFAHVNTMMSEDRAALRVTGTGGCVIVDNRFDDTFFGIALGKVDGCRVERNVLVGAKADESNSGDGIHLWSVRDAVLRDNRITGHRDGIYFEFTRLGLAERNVSEGNHRYGLHFMYSDSCAYVGNTFRRNGSGVAVMYTKTVTMTGNRFVDNPGAAAYGLLLKEIERPVLVGNLFAGNTVGLMADGATDLAATANVFRDNGWAVQLMANVQAARFASNDFTGNSFDVATNSRDDGATTFDGNYYDDYRGWDLDRDGRGDPPHRPVRLFSILVARYQPALVLQRSFFVGLLDAAERVLPALTPATIADARPALAPVARRAAPGAAARAALPLPSPSLPR